MTSKKFGHTVEKLCNCIVDLLGYPEAKPFCKALGKLTDKLAEKRSRKV